MSEKIDHGRRRLLRNAVVAVAAAELTTIGFADAQTKARELSEAKPGTNTSLGAIKQIDAAGLKENFVSATSGEMKLAAILFLACAVVLGPVAWTLDACTDEDFEGEPAATLYADGHPNFYESEAKPVPVIHCARQDPLGPALEEPPLEMTGCNKPAPAAASRHASGPASLHNAAALDALFKKRLLPVHNAPYLFLSVLRI